MSIHETLLAALAAAPARAARPALDRLEADDFPNWIHSTIFTAMTRCTWPTTPDPGSIAVQLDRKLRSERTYQQRHDTGLRAAVLDLAGANGHADLLDEFVTEVIETRYRRAVRVFAGSIADHAEHSPLEDVVVALRGTAELQRLHDRIHTRPALHIVKEGF